LVLEVLPWLDIESVEDLLLLSEASIGIVDEALRVPDQEDDRTTALAFSHLICCGVEIILLLI
jgi:hypothetical protein